MKVAYRNRYGESRAYLDEEPREDGAHVGIDKYTDEHVALRWDDEAEEWAIVEDGEAKHE